MVDGDKCSDHRHRDLPGVNDMKYRDAYKWSNIGAMLHNMQLDPAVCTDDVHDRTVVITGATSGIGYATALKYAAHGANIVSVNRNEEKSERLCETLRRDYSTACTYLVADFARLTDVHRAAKQLSAWNRRIDVLIHNVGVFATNRTLTVDGLELVFQTNYLSSFILNYHLREKLRAQRSGRILFVNSEAYRFAVTGLKLDDLAWDRRRYSGLKSYGAAKLAQLLSMIKLNECFAGTGVTVNAMHPGNVKTNSGQNNGAVYRFLKKLLVDRTAKSPEVAAKALYYLGVSGDLDDTSGKFFNLTTEEEPAPPALDREAAEELWELSLKLGRIR
jgi:NAD(P)-dependent dehydrogenase (short-subunit alcohol dehydrogenase family)